jgi:hypothetical protein
VSGSTGRFFAGLPKTVKDASSHPQEVLLRVYAVLTLVIFGLLLIRFTIQTPFLADEPKGAELGDLEWSSVW